MQAQEIQDDGGEDAILPGLEDPREGDARPLLAKERDDGKDLPTDTVGDRELREDARGVAQLAQTLQVLEAMRAVGADGAGVGAAHSGLELDHIALGRAVAVVDEDHDAVGDALLEVDLVEDVSTARDPPVGQDAPEDGVERVVVLEHGSDFLVDLQMPPSPRTLAGVR